MSSSTAKITGPGLIWAKVRSPRFAFLAAYLNTLGAEFHRQTVSRQGLNSESSATVQLANSDPDRGWKNSAAYYLFILCGAVVLGGCRGRYIPRRHTKHASTVVEALIIVICTGSRQAQIPYTVLRKPWGHHKCCRRHHLQATGGLVPIAHAPNASVFCAQMATYVRDATVCEKNVNLWYHRANVRPRSHHLHAQHSWRRNWMTWYLS